MKSLRLLRKSEGGGGQRTRHEVLPESGQRVVCCTRGGWVLQGAGQPGQAVKVPKTAMRQMQKQRLGGCVCKSRNSEDGRQTPEPAGATDGGPSRFPRKCGPGDTLPSDF